MESPPPLLAPPSGVSAAASGDERAPARNSPPLLCDVVEVWGPTGGGIRSYVDAKARWFTEVRGWHHLLVIPGESDGVVTQGGRTTVSIRSPRIPGCDPYRFLLRHREVVRAVTDAAPTAVEFGSSYFLRRVLRGIRRRTAARCIGFYHTDYPDAYVHRVVGRVAGPLAARLVRRWARTRVRSFHGRLDATVASSPLLVGQLQREGVPRIRHVSLGVDLECFHPSARQARVRTELGIGEEDLLLIFVGRFDVEKQVEVLVEALHRIPMRLPVRLILVGEGPLLPRLRKTAARDPRLILEPYTRDRRTVARILASADLYVTAGPHETFALSVLEAQACGLPVVGVEAGALVDRVPPETGRLVPVGDAGALAREVLSISPEERRRMGRAARSLADETGSWAAAFERLEAIYLGRPSPRGARGGLKGQAVGATSDSPPEVE